MTSFSSPCLLWLLYVFLALVFVEKLIVGCYRIRRAKAVSFECQSLIWVLELYPSVIHHSLTVGPSACIITSNGRSKKPPKLDKSCCWEASPTMLRNAETSVWSCLWGTYSGVHKTKSFVAINLPRWSWSSQLHVDLESLATRPLSGQKEVERPPSQCLHSESCCSRQKLLLPGAANSAGMKIFPYGFCMNR